MKEYHKIDGLYKRDNNKRLMRGVYRNPMVEYLKNCEWEFTEKIDGMNIRVVWDGHSVSFYGRTDNAQLPGRLRIRLEELFGGEVNETIFEELFGDKQVTIYGEGYGEKIQNGGAYTKGNNFIMFDVEVENMFLYPENVRDIAHRFGCETVPIVLTGKLCEAEEFVESRPMSMIGGAKMEGVVGRPLVPVHDRCGKRVIVKIKVRDYEEMESYND